MAQKQTNPFKTVSQKFGDNEFYTQISVAGEDAFLTFHFDGDYFIMNKPILGVSSANPTGNEVVIRGDVSSLVANYVTYIGTPGISGTTVGKIIVSGNEYPIVVPGGSSGSTVSISDTLVNGNKIATVTIDGTGIDLKSPKPNWDAAENTAEGIQNRTHYSYFGSESQSGVLAIWSMTAEGTDYYYGFKSNYLYGYEVVPGNYYRVEDVSSRIQEFTSQAVECVASRSFVGSPIAGTGVGNLNMLNSSLPDTGEELAILFYNWDGARCDALVVGKYENGNAYSLTLYEKEKIYVPLNIGYIPSGIQRENTTESTSLNLVPGKFNNLGNVDFNDIVYSVVHKNSIVYGQFTSTASGTMTTSTSGSQTYWRGDTTITAGNTYQFFILNQFGKIEQILGV